MKTRRTSRAYSGAIQALAAILTAVATLCAGCSLFNKVPAVPSIAGPTTGVAGIPVTCTATTIDPDGDSVAFQFDCGDNSALEWTAFLASGAAFAIQHTYADSGAYTIKVKAKDKGGKESGWSGGHSLKVIAAGRSYPDSVVGQFTVRNNLFIARLNSDVQDLYVGNYASGAGDSACIWPVRLQDRTVGSPVNVGGSGYSFVVTSDCQTMYVCNASDDEVLSIRLADLVIVNHRPLGSDITQIAVSNDGARLFVGSWTDSVLFVLRASDLSVTDTVVLPDRVGNMTLSPDGSRLYLGLRSQLAVLDAQTLQVLKSVVLDGPPANLCMSPDGRTLYVNCTGSALTIVSADDLSILGHLDVGEPIYSLPPVVSPDSIHLYVGVAAGWHVYDLRTQAVVSMIPGDEPGSVGVMDPSGDTLYWVGWRNVYVVGR